jgi:dTDP-4-dehydrorhamnose 3,5-epimerase
MPFTFTPAALPGVVVIEPTVFGDDRGFFMETYKKSDFAGAGLDVDFVQENHSKSVEGTLRGLHLQRAPKAQGKLVRAVEGEIFDVAADIRRESPTFGKWVSVVLSAENRRSVFIPAGYAHGFCVVSSEAQVVYKTTAEYAPELEWGVRWDDPLLAISWPVYKPLLSQRDGRWPFLARTEE